jgi:hypothetical protein
MRCTRFVGPDGAVHWLTDAMRSDLLATVTEMASRGLRTLCLAYTDFPATDASRAPDFFEAPPDDDLVAAAIVGIKVGLALALPSSVGEFTGDRRSQPCSSLQKPACRRTPSRVLADPGQTASAKCAA